VKKNSILGITALVAVVGLGMMFTACPAVEDDVERVVTFKNYTKATITINCEGSPAQVTLNPATSSLDENQKATVIRKGKDVVLLTISISGITIPSGDEWNYIELGGSLAPGDKKGKNGLSLKGGELYFKGAPMEGGNIIGWKVGMVQPDDE